MLNYSCAVLNAKIVGDDRIYFVPIRVCIGKYDKKNNLFYDYLSNSVIPNLSDSAYLNFDNAFSHVTSFLSVFKSSKSLSFNESIQKFLLANRKKVTIARFDDEKNMFTFNEYDVDDLDLDDVKVRFYNMDRQTEMILDSREMLDSIFEQLSNSEKSSSDDNDGLVESENKLVRISQLYEDVKTEVISQDEPIKKIITAVYKNLMFDGKEMKSNILIYGSTGVGKTQILRSLSKRVGVPLWIEDMTKYTESGYKGGDVEDILYNLLENANMNQELAEKSILVLDEIDKKAGTNGDSAVSKSDVLKNLLAIIEGGVFPLQYAGGTIQFDTSKLTIVACGAFTELRESKLSKSKPIGFSGETHNIDTNPEITIEDFQKFGMPLEFMGRFRTIVQMNELKKEDFIKILKMSTLSPLNRYKAELEKLGIAFETSDDLYDKLATYALKCKTGARALNVVVDQLFEDILYEIFDNSESIESLRLSEKDEDGIKLELRKREKNERSEAEGRK